MIHNSPLALPNRDLQRCFDIVGISRWQRLAGQRLFITGGTGFVGKWLLGTLIHASETLDLGCHITVLSRNPEAFLSKWPLIASQISWITGDVCNFNIPSKPCDFIIHAATDVGRQVSVEDLFLTISEGARRIVELARRCRASRLLFLSSGAAAHGQLSKEIQIRSLINRGASSLLQSQSAAYAVGKQIAEQLIAEASLSGAFSCRIARLFSAVGPHLPMSQHFAIGNFIGDAMANRAITINGDGSSVRSYLYAADMVGWLWSILLEEATPRHIYNVGSSQSISILDLARLVKTTIGSPHPVALKNAQQGLASMTIRALGSDYYVPECTAAMHDLDLPQPLDLAEAIKRTADWYRFRAYSEF